jgi:hypothetical protein
MQLGPWAMGVAVPAKIRRLRRRGRPGKGRRRVRGSPEIGLWRKLGLGRLRWWPAAAPGGGGRWSCCSGEESGAAATQAARIARVVQGKEARGVTWLRECTGGGARWQRRARRGGDGVRARGRLAAAFIARAASCLSDEGTPALTPQYSDWPRWACSAGGHATDCWSWACARWRVRHGTGQERSSTRS